MISSLLTLDMYVVPQLILVPRKIIRYVNEMKNKT
jgi:hypothetical protein